MIKGGEYEKKGNGEGWEGGMMVWGKDKEGKGRGEWKRYRKGGMERGQGMLIKKRKIGKGKEGGGRK